MDKKKDKNYFAHKNYAHRGLHDLAHGIPENSLAAFRAAAEAGYGVELDVQLSKDGKVVVFHDDDLKRVCGVDGYVRDYDYADLKKMRLLGTEEKIPLFADVLRVLESGPSDLVCELKTCEKKDELCGKTLALLDTYRGKYCVESFDPFIVSWFRKNSPGTVRGLLSMSAEGFRGQNFGPVKAALLGNCTLAVLCRPDFIAYKNQDRSKKLLRRCRRHERMLFAWTSRIPDVDQEQNDAVIFEGYRPTATY